VISHEERIAELLAETSTVNWHVAWMVVGIAYRGAPDRDRHVAGFLRRHTLHMIGVALIEGYDGGEVAPKPRSAQEHRVGEVYIGSLLLHEFDRFDGVDWWHVDTLLQERLGDVDQTPPLRRAA
jgi:hypothetical protein